MHLTVKGQVTIPKSLRERYGLESHSEVKFEATARGILITSAQADRVARFREGLKKVRGNLRGMMSSAELTKLTRNVDLQ